MAELQVGDPAPNFETTTDQGEAVSLNDFRGQRVVLYFYPKDDTPGCTKQACSFRDNHAQLTQHNAVVLGVSPDSEGSHQKFKDKFQLNFPLLVDEDHAISEAYGVWGEKTSFGRTYMGVNRSQFIIDEEGKLIDVHYQIGPEESVPEALAVLTA